MRLYHQSALQNIPNILWSKSIPELHLHNSCQREEIRQRLLVKVPVVEKPLMKHLPMTHDVLYLFLVLQSALRVISMSCICLLVRQSALRERDRLLATETITLMSNILPIHLTSRMMRKGENMITNYDS